MWKFAYFDSFGAFGGFIYGITSILWLLPPDGSRNSCQRVGFWIGLLTNIILTVALVAVFAASSPKQFWYGDPNNPNDSYSKGIVKN